MDTLATWPYPDELDALTAAPRHHRLLFENEWVRILDTRIAPGEMTGLHTHRWPGTLYLISWSDFIRYDADGNVMLDSRTLAAPPAPGTAVWTEPLIPHSLENIGNADLHVISVELKKTGS